MDKILSEVNKKSDEAKNVQLARILKFIANQYNINQSDYYIGTSDYAMRDKRDLDSITVVLKSSERDKIPRDLGVIEPYGKVVRRRLDLQGKNPTTIFFLLDYNDSLTKLKADKSLATDDYGNQFINLQTVLQMKQDQGKLDDVKLIKSLLAEENSLFGFTQNQLIFAFLILLVLLIVVFFDSASSLFDTVYEKIISLF